MTEELSPQQRGANKSGAFRTARKKARDSGVPVYVEEYDHTIMPDGTGHAGSHDKPVVETVAGPRATKEPVVTVGGPPAPAVQEHGDLGDETIPPLQPGDMGYGDDPSSLLGWANHFVGLGLDEDDAMVMAARKMPGTIPMPQMGGGATVQGTPGDAETNRPDQHLIDVYNERMKGYVEPVLDRTYEVTLPVRFADYIDRRAAWESGVRRREVEPAEMIALICRHAKANDQDYSILMHPNAGTGNPVDFNPSTGTYT